MRLVIGATAIVALVLTTTGTAAAQAAAAGGFAYIDIQRVAAESNDGQSANAKVDELSQQKLAEIEAVSSEGQGRISALNQELQEAQLKLQQGQNVLSADAAAGLQRQIVRLQRDVERNTQDLQAELQRLSQDAEAEVQEVQQGLQIEFEGRLVPAIDKLAAEKQLSFIFNAQQGLVWADPSLDLTQELIAVLNSGSAATP